MSIELKIPSFGESVTEAYLGEWLRKEGDQVQQDEPVVVIETDKVTAELPAPVSGVITRVLKQQGESASIGEIIGYMEEGEVAAAVGDGSVPATTGVAEPVPPADATSSKTPPRVMPAARRLLEEKGVDATAITPTGPGGRILKEDVQRHDREATARRAAPTAPAAPTGPAAAPVGPREEEIVPMSRLRLRIAERLVEAQQTAAMLTTFNEIDMSAVKEMRAAYQDAFTRKYEIKLGFMSFFVKATIDALRLVPRVNAFIDGENVVYHNYQDIGIAVGGGRGLVVPVIRNAERMSFAEIERAIADFATRARDNRLELDELQGGTFTISNGGIYGSMLSTPILNPPQSGILGLHNIQDRPVAVDGQVVVRPMMYVALTYDHRIVDGREAVTFLRRIKECVENPSRMLLEI